MPAIPKPVLIVRVFAANAGGGQAWSNVSYWSPAAVYDATTIQAAADDAMTLVGGALSSCLCIASNVITCQVEYLNGSTELMANTTNAPIAGQVAQYPMPEEVCVVLRKKTGLAGRSKAGRFFVSGLSTAQVDQTYPDELRGASLGDFQTYAAIYAGDQTFGTVLCHSRHWDRKNNVLVPIVAMAVSSRFASRDDRRRHAPNLPL